MGLNFSTAIQIIRWITENSSEGADSSQRTVHGTQGFHTGDAGGTLKILRIASSRHWNSAIAADSTNLHLLAAGSLIECSKIPHRCLTQH